MIAPVKLGVVRRCTVSFDCFVPNRKVLMRVFLACLFAVVGLVNTSSAAMVFTTVRQNSNPILIGDNVSFNIVVFSNDANVLNLVGPSGDISISGLAGQGGVFTSGTVAGISGGFFGGPSGSTTQFATSFANVQLINTTPFTVGTLTINTAGAVEGTYNLNSVPDLSDFAWDDFSGNPQPAYAVIGGSTSFTITAVPEPTSMVLVGLVGGCAGLRLWRKRRASV